MKIILIFASFIFLIQQISTNTHQLNEKLENSQNPISKRFLRLGGKYKIISINYYF